MSILLKILGKARKHLWILLVFAACVGISTSLQAQDEGEQPNDEVSAAIYGGSEANENDWPGKTLVESHYIAKTGPLKDKPVVGRCGGSLITSEWVLTAAHCLYDDGGNLLTKADFIVTIGRNDLRKTNVGEVFTVSQIIKHAQFAALHNDIALLRLDHFSSAKTMKLATPLYLQGLSIGDPTKVIGWGSISPDLPLPDVLHQVTVPLVDNIRCSVTGGSIGKLICAGSPSKDSCQGDSGGPLMSNKFDSQTWTQIGIVSWGYGCGLTYGVYTNVAAYLDWIKYYTEGNSCTIGGVGAASTSLTVDCGTPPSTPVPAPSPAPGNPAPAPAPTPNPSDFTGINFYREKNFSGFITKMGYGTFNFTDDFLSVRMDRSDMRFTVYDSGGGKDCFDSSRLGGRSEHPSFNDHGDWWWKTTSIVVEYGSCPAGTPPPKRIVFFREKNFSSQVAERSVGWEGDFTENFQSLRLDAGISFYVRDERNVYRCFDLNDFDGRNEHPSFNDHGDWWHNIVWMRVQGKLCEPHDVHMTSPVKDSTIAYNTDVTVVFNVPPNSLSIYGELVGMPQTWYYHQPASVSSWHLGYLPPGPYIIRLRAVNDNGTSNWTDNRFNIASPPNCSTIPVNGVGLFDGSGCSGEVVNLLNPGVYTLGAMDNRVSAVQVPDGWSVEMRQSNTTSDGSAECVSSTRGNLGQWKFYQSTVEMNNTTSTVEVFTTPNCGRQTPLAFCHQLTGNQVILFDYTYCGGKDLILPPGQYELSDLRFFNMATSIYIPDGKSLRVYAGAGQTGNFACWKGSKWLLYLDEYFGTLATADNDIAAVEVFDDANCGGLQTPHPYLYIPPATIDTETELVAGWENLKAQTYLVVVRNEAGNEVLNSGSLAPSETTWNMGKLSAGTYTWQVYAFTEAETKVSETIKLTVLEKTEPQPEPTATSMPIPPTPTSQPQPDLTPSPTQDPTVTPQPIPNTPGGLKMISANSSSITMTWNDNTNETEYLVYRHSGSEFILIATLGQDQTTINDSGLNCSTVVTYAVQARNGSGVSALSIPFLAQTAACQQQPDPQMQIFLPLINR